jgi:putative salt-induced outer membrane protein YdiY
MTKTLPDSQRYLVKVVWLCVICSFFLGASVHAQTKQADDPRVKEEASASEGFALADVSIESNTSATESENIQSGSPKWFPSSALPEKFDWIQLTSGEWLKGEFKVLYEDKLEFDSDELGLLELDWEDIKQVLGHQFYSVRFEMPTTTVVGMLKVVDDKVFVNTEKDVLEFDRSRLVSIAHGESKEIDNWSAKISFSFDTRSGNTEQINYSTSAYAQRRTTASRFYVDYLGIFNQTDGIDTANSQRASSYYDIFRSRKIFWRPLQAEYFKDPFANIANRVTVGAGMGFHIIDTSKTEWDVTPSISYQYTQNVSVGPGEDKSNSTPALGVGTVYDTEITKQIDFKVNYNFFIVNQESGTYTHHAIVALEIELTRRLDFDVSFVWDRIQDPTPAADGSVPKQDDFYLFLGIGFEL